MLSVKKRGWRGWKKKKKKAEEQVQRRWEKAGHTFPFQLPSPDAWRGSGGVSCFSGDGPGVPGDSALWSPVLGNLGARAVHYVV